MTGNTTVSQFVREQRYLSLMTAQRMRLRVGESILRGECPLCGGSRFDVDRATETFHCGGCNSAGDALDLMVSMGGFVDVDAARDGVFSFMQRGVSLVDAIWPTVGPMLEAREAAEQPWEKVDLSDMGDPLEPMIPGYLGQAELVQLIAKSGAGKSTLAGSMIASLLGNIPFLGVTPVVRPINVGWLHFDSAMQRLGEMIARFPGLATDDRFSSFRGRSGDYLDEASGLASVTQLIHRNGLQLLVIDALASGIEGDENDTQSMGKLAYGLVAVAEVTGCTILLLHHMGKTGSDGRGSTNLRGATDRLLKLSRRGGVITLTVDKEREGWQPDPVKFRHVLRDGQLLLVQTDDVADATKQADAPDRWGGIRQVLVDQGRMPKTSLAKTAPGNNDKNASEIARRLVAGDLVWPDGEGRGKPVALAGGR